MELKQYVGKAKKHWLKLFILLIALSGIYYFFFRSEDQAPATVPKISTVERGDLRVTVTGTGQVEAASQVDLKSVVAGDAADVTSVQVKEDQEVRKGQIIATVDSTDASRNVQAAALSLRSAELKMKQTEKLYDTKTEDDKLQRQLQEVSVQQSQISLAQARERLSDYTIRAPFDGIVTGLNVEAGDALANNTVIASVITKEMKVGITLNEVDAAKVTKGNEVNLTFDALPGIQLKGKIEKLDTIGTTESGVVSYGAEITLDEQNKSLRPGMSVSAEIVVSEKQDVLLIPNEAITTEDGKSYVRVLSGSPRAQSSNTEDTSAPRGEMREIEIGVTNDVDTEVINGLSEGERILAGTQSTSALSAPASAQNRSGINSLFGGPRTGGGGQRPQNIPGR